MLISPAERPVSFWAPLGKTSPVPEQLGCDFLMFSPVFGLVGVQRKEFNDLVASLADGRVAKEIIQMKEGVDVGIWLIEGQPTWSVDGQLLSDRSTFTIDSYRGVTWSLQSQGFWTASTTSSQDSMSWLCHLEKWMAKPKHNGLNGRPAARNMLGEPSTKDWQIHLVQSLPGVGYERARAIVDHLGGLPFTLRTDMELSDVPGVGKVTKERIERMFVVRDQIKVEQ